MTRTLLLSSAVVLTLTTGALAADLPNVKGPPVYTPPPPPEFTWTGFYIGANAGSAWGDFQNAYEAPGGAFPNFFPGDAFAISANGSNRLKPFGFAGGGQAGFNYQVNNLLVLGIETDFDYLGLSKSTGGIFITGAGPQITNTTVSSHWLYTLRPRIGVAFGPALFYATGGLAIADVGVNETNTFPLVNTGSDVFSARTARVGWTVGGGAEYRIDNHWSIKAEYLYSRFGTLNGTSSSNTPFGGVIAPIFYSHHIQLVDQTARAGVNYKFDLFAPTAPVVAKY